MFVNGCLYSFPVIGNDGSGFQIADEFTEPGVLFRFQCVHRDGQAQHMGCQLADFQAAGQRHFPDCLRVLVVRAQRLIQLARLFVFRGFDPFDDLVVTLAGQHLRNSRDTLDLADGKGRTALMDAVLAFKVDVIRYLLEKGADINKRDKEGCTCLMRASYGGYTDLVIYLIRKGADKTVTDNAGRTALQYVRTTSDEELLNVLKQ